MRAAATAVLCLSVLACSGGADTPDAVPDAPKEPSPPPASCPATEELDETYDSDLAAIDLQTAPAELPLDALPELDRMTIAYMLERPVGALGDTLSRDDLLAGGFMARAIVAGYVGHPDKPDMILVRRGLSRYYYCYRAPPKTLEQFIAERFDYTGQPAEAIPSEPKLGDRHVYKELDDMIFVAETVFENEIVETEMLLGGGQRADDCFDFFAYDKAGDLSKTSTFAVNEETSASIDVPIACMTCHFKVGTCTIIEPHLGD